MRKTAMYMIQTCCNECMFTCTYSGPEGCTEEFVGGMPVYCGFESDVLLSLTQYFSSFPDPLISPKLYDLHMAVLRELIIIPS